LRSTRSARGTKLRVASLALLGAVLPLAALEPPADAAGRVPTQYIIESGAPEYVLPLDGDHGMCFLSGFSGPGAAYAGPKDEISAGYANVLAAFPVSHPQKTTATATCYDWSDFSNAPVHDLTGQWFGGAADGGTQVIGYQTGELCVAIGIENLNHAGDEINLVYDSDDVSWSSTLYDSVHDPRSVAWTWGECRWFGKQVQYAMQITDVAGSDESQQPLPRADEYFCTLKRVVGDATNGFVKLSVNLDRRWQLLIGGDIQRAEASCFSLDFSPGCHSLSTLGGIHVCPTNISSYVREIDPFCATTAWDGWCVNEATCADSVCAADPYCCKEQWDATCQGEYAASCQ
jgi:hypothetical protein